MIIDVIILSYSKTDREYQMTRKCLSTLRQSEANFKFNVVVVESNPNITKEGFAERILFNDPEALVLAVTGKFNYNQFLQIGYEKIKSDSKFLLICNNDLIFYKGWLTEIFKHIDRADSFSPFCPTFHKSRYLKQQPIYTGYGLWDNLVGWCIFMKKTIFVRTRFDQYFPVEFNFWFQDNYYLEVLKHNRFKQCLVRNSLVLHLGSKSHSLISKDELHRMTNGSKAIFDKMKTKLNKSS